MVFEDIKNKSIKALPRQSEKYLEKAFEILLNRIDDFENEIKFLKEKNQKLMDENNRLKGEKGRPNIPPSKDKDNNFDSSEQGKKRPPKKRGKPTKKKNKIKVHKKIEIGLDKASLPDDAEYKGSRKVIIQDIDFNLHNTEFNLAKYYSPSEKITYEGELPPEYKGSSFGPGVRSFILHFHYEARMTQNIIHTILTGVGIQISEGQISNIIRDCKISNKKDGMCEKRELNEELTNK